MPFLLWSAHPLGNPGRPPNAPGAGDEAGQAAHKALIEAEEELRSKVGEAGGDILLWPLPGITKDWSFTDNWVSNIGLAGALVTTLFASTDAIEQLLGSGTVGAGALVAVAGAISAALISSGPMWLTIWKRRYVLQDGIARHNTLGGVLCASFAVLTGAVGLVLVAAWALDLRAGWIGAALVVAFLLLYAWKSIPQTLALGLHAGAAPTTDGAEVPRRAQPEPAGTRIPARGPEPVAAML